MSRVSVSDSAAVRSIRPQVFVGRTNSDGLREARPTGLDVSRICLGCMSYGEPDRGNHAWALDEEQSRPFIQQAVEAGINFFDTANVYSDGTSEEIVGRALKDFARPRRGRARHQGVRPDAAGPERRRPVAQGDHDRDRQQPAPARHRLRRPLPDPPLGLRTPIEETLEALHDVVKAGKARYIGASSMYAWQFAKALHLAERHGWTRFVSMQNHYNLLYREEEREMMPLCADQGIGVIPWSPLARGRLTRDWDATTRPQRDRRVRQDPVPATRTATIVERVAEVAEARGVLARAGRAGLAARASRWSPRRSSARRSRSTSTTRSPSVDLQLTAEEIDATGGALPAARDSRFCISSQTGHISGLSSRLVLA